MGRDELALVHIVYVVRHAQRNIEQFAHRFSAIGSLNLHLDNRILFNIDGKMSGCAGFLQENVVEKNIWVPRFVILLFGELARFFQGRLRKTLADKHFGKFTS